jgi:tight adherence protein C
LSQLKRKDRDVASLLGRKGLFLTRLMRSLLDYWVERFRTSRNVEEQVREKLVQAGFPFGMRAREFIALRQILSLIYLLMGLELTYLASLYVSAIQLFHYAIAALMGAFVGNFIPNFALGRSIRKRRAAVQTSLPDFIDLLTVSVEAGLGFDAAWQRVAEQFPGPLAEEGMQVVHEVRVGRTRPEALRDMARRLKIVELSLLVNAIVQADQLGARIGNALRIQSQQIRNYRTQRAREKAQKAPVKIVVVLILFILPTLGVVVVGPTLITAWDNLKGIFGGM